MELFAKKFIADFRDFNFMHQESLKTRPFHTALKNFMLDSLEDFLQSAHCHIQDSVQVRSNFNSIFIEDLKSFNRCTF